MKKAYYLKVCTKLWKFRSWICIFHVCWKLIDEVISYVLDQVKKKHVSRSDKRERAGGVFFVILLFPIAYFLYTLLPSPRDTLELLGQVLTQRNIRY